MKTKFEEEVIQLINSNSNDSDLGKVIRKLYSDNLKPEVGQFDNLEGCKLIFSRSFYFLDK